MLHGSKEVKRVAVGQDSVEKGQAATSSDPNCLIMSQGMWKERLCSVVLHRFPFRRDSKVIDEYLRVAPGVYCFQPATNWG